MNKSRVVWISLITIGAVASLAHFSPIPLMIYSMIGLPFLIYDVTSSVGKIGSCNIAGVISVVEEEY